MVDKYVYNYFGNHAFICKFLNHVKCFILTNELQEGGVG